MKVTYNGTALHDLGVLQILGQTVAREPAETPKRERHELRLRLTFFHATYLANAGGVASVRAALKTQLGRLLVEDRGGYVLVDRIVHVSPDEEPEDGRGPLAGTSMQAIALSFWWEEHDVTHNGLGLTVQRAGGTLRDLGSVEHFAEAFKTTLADELRPHRRRTGGQVSATGCFKSNAAATLAVRRAALQKQVTDLQADLVRNTSVRMIHGTFDRTVRILDFEPKLNDAVDRIDWSLTASYTAFPEETDYTIADYRITTRENLEEASLAKTLSGKIAAPTAAAALAKLDRIKTAYFAAGYALIHQEFEDTYFGNESQRGTGTDVGDGETFLEFTFTCEFRKLSGDILNYTYQVSVVEDIKGGLQRTTYSGTVRARGATVVAAYAAAAAKAAELGAGKAGFFLGSSLTQTLPQEFSAEQLQAGVPPFFVTVQFSYEYQAKGARTYLEFVAELTRDEFGNTVENVQGYATALTFADAQTAYVAHVRSLAAFEGVLLLNERTTSGGEERLVKLEAEAADSTLPVRVNFSFQLQHAKGEVRVQYSVEPEYDWENLIKRTTLSGTVWGATVAECTARVEALGAALVDAGVRKRSRRQEQYLTGVDLAAEATTALVCLTFQEEYEQTLAGSATILECTCEEDILYSGTRWIEKPLPDGPPLIQQAGTTMCKRSVSGRVKAPTTAACLNWAKRVRRLLLVGGPNLAVDEKYEQPPQLTWTFEFLPLTEGVPVQDVNPGSEAPANVRVHVCSFRFEEWIPEHEFVADNEVPG